MLLRTVGIEKIMVVLTWLPCVSVHVCSFAVFSATVQL